MAWRSLVSKYQRNSHRPADTVGSDEALIITRPKRDAVLPCNGEFESSLCAKSDFFVSWIFSLSNLCWRTKHLDSRRYNTFVLIDLARCCRCPDEKSLKRVILMSESR